MKPVGYDKWLEKQDVGTCGVSAIITKKLYDKGCFEAIDRAGEMMGKSIARYLYPRGTKVDKIEHNVAFDVMNIGWENYIYADEEFDGSPEMYCYMAYENWCNELTKRTNFASKSIYYYLKYCLRRFWYHNIKKKEVKELEI